MKIDCETCDSRLQCVGVNVNKHLCVEAHKALHTILVEMQRRVPSEEAAIMDVCLIETHNEKVDTPEEVVVSTSVGVELLPMTNGDWHWEGNWGRVERNLLDPQGKPADNESFTW